MKNENELSYLIENYTDKKEKSNRFLFTFIFLFLKIILFILFFVGIYLVIKITITQIFFIGENKKEINIEDPNEFQEQIYFHDISNIDEENVPYGSPVEKGRYTYGYDTNSYKKHSILDKYIPFYKTYEKHRGLDFGRTWKDHANGYSPFIITPISGKIKRIEYREESQGNNLNYKKYLFQNGRYIKLNSTSTKNKEGKEKPYGNHIVVSSSDGKFYVMFAHLENISKNLDYKENIKKGTILGKMGTTGNSTGIHLHYEIRFCGNNNNDLNLTFRQCQHVNPLGFLEGKPTSFLGTIDLGNGEIYYGDRDKIKKKIISEQENKSKEYEIFCQKNSYIMSNKEICKLVYVFYKKNQNRELLPGESSLKNIHIIGEKYLQKKYGDKYIQDNIQYINSEEGSTGKNLSEIAMDVGKNLSYGKYSNQYTFYKKDILSKEEPEKIEELLIQDLYEVISSFYNSSDEVEKIFMKYLQINEQESPIIYNNYNSKYMFMPRYNEKGEIIGRYQSDGLLTIYSYLQ